MAEGIGIGRARVEPFGDAALLVVLGEHVDRAVNDRVHRLAIELDLRAARLPGLGVTVPAYASVLVPFDPLVLAEAAVRGVIADALRVAGEAVAAKEAATAPEPATAADLGPVTHVPVRYGGADGPDLAEVAVRTGLSEDDVVRLHAGAEYRVFCLGFLPGFPYLGMLPAELALARRSTPRLRVPAGSVAIAGRQTGIYPSETPGGWHIIGRTDLSAWDPHRDPPALLEPGARVRFGPA
jgi:KipI family sensor histidine kinase inhibitor